LECEFNRTQYKRRLDNDSGHEHLTASILKEVLGRYFQDENSKTPLEVFRSLQYLTMKSSGACQIQGSPELQDAFRSIRKVAVLDYEELRSLSDLEPRDFARGVHIVG
jgi:hypothetical protein